MLTWVPSRRLSPKSLWNHDLVKRVNQTSFHVQHWQEAGTLSPPPKEEASHCWRKPSFGFNAVIKHESHLSSLRRRAFEDGGLRSISHDRLCKQSPGGQGVNANQLNKELWLRSLSSGWRSRANTHRSGECELCWSKASHLWKNH